MLRVSRCAKHRQGRVGRVPRAAMEMERIIYSKEKRIMTDGFSFHAFVPLLGEKPINKKSPETNKKHTSSSKRKRPEQREQRGGHTFGRTSGCLD